MTLLPLLALLAATTQPAATIPFQLVDNRIFVSASINGGAPMPFLFDTGGRALLHDDVARRLKLRVEETGSVPGTGGEMVPSGHTMVGDRIAAIDGVPTSRLLLPEVRERFRTAAEGTITMTVLRGKSRMTRKLELHDFLSGVR